MERKRLILASASPRRQELLRLITEDFTVVVSDADETVSPDLSPTEMVEALALRKARAVWELNRDARVIGSDTIVVLDSRVLGKPVDRGHAAEMLAALSGRTHTVYTGVAVVGPGGTRSFVERADVTFAELDEKKIAAYIATGEPMDKAGAYGIQGKGALLVREIQGDFYAVMGLPVCRLSQVLEATGETGGKL